MTTKVGLTLAACTLLPCTGDSGTGEGIRDSQLQISWPITKQFCPLPRIRLKIKAGKP